MTKNDLNEIINNNPIFDDINKEKKILDQILADLSNFNLETQNFNTKKLILSESNHLNNFSEKKLFNNICNTVCKNREINSINKFIS